MPARRSAACGANVAIRRPPPRRSNPGSSGPTNRMPAARQVATSASWRPAPSAPDSANPALRTRSARTPLSLRSHARRPYATFAGRGRHDDQLGRLGKLGDRPVRGEALNAPARGGSPRTPARRSPHRRMFRSVCPSHAPRARRDAPTTAIDAGSRKWRTAAAADIRSRSSYRPSAVLVSAVVSSICSSPPGRAAPPSGSRFREKPPACGGCCGARRRRTCRSRARVREPPAAPSESSRGPLPRRSSATSNAISATPSCPRRARTRREQRYAPGRRSSRSRLRAARSDAAAAQLTGELHVGCTGEVAQPARS